MRNAFAEELTKLGAADPRVVLLSGDIGNRLFEPFKESCPGRFFNCGVAEANMMSMAAGIGLEGLRPVVYTITPFTTTRCLEQIRVDACYHESPVIIVGTGAGLSYAALGATHHSLEDIAILRPLPGMTIVCPCDAVELRLALAAALRLDGPVYLRIGKKGEPIIHRDTPEFEIGKAITLRQGRDACIAATGSIMPAALEAADRLEAEGISAGVESFHTIKPLDTPRLAELFRDHAVVATVEEHGLIGGLGAAVAEFRAETGNGGARLVRFGTADEFLHAVGSQDYARRVLGLTPERIAAGIRSALGAG